MRLAPASPSARQRWLEIVALVALTVALRLPFMTQTLYAFDSANYALAVRDFYNVAFHQPHPPGYPLYVFFARAIASVRRIADSRHSTVWRSKSTPVRPSFTVSSAPPPA